MRRAGQQDLDSEEVDPTLRVADVYRRFGPVVNDRARVLLNDKEEAWEVTQETFVVFVEKYERVKKESEAFTLLYAIASNLAVTRLRERARRSKRLIQGFAAEVGQEGANESEARRVESALELALLTRGESRQSMTVALLHFVDGCTVTEVGDALDLSRRTVRRLLDRFVARARKRSTRFGEHSK
jgi:RNA polymerase sigma-70 factor (ECF subfamily)